MSTHPIRGKTLVFTFTDGPMADNSFEHAFHHDGSVDFGMAGNDQNDQKDQKDQKTRVEKAEVAKAGPDVYAVSYLADSGYTLTCVLDFATSKLVAFSSNEKEHALHHGRFEVR